MAALNTSIEGTAISKAYQSVVDAPLAGASPTFAQWAIYAVQAPLASAFQNDSGKESVLKVFRTGEGELAELAEDFSEGKIEFGFVKVKDPNTSLPKSVLIAWCGQGVPERTKGYFTSHLATVSRILHGYHVQVTARTDDDLQPDAIIRKVQDASGSKYSGGGTAPMSTGGPKPPVASKPVFTPSRIGAGSTFQPLGSRSRTATPSGPVDDDGWGADAPPVSRSQLEKVDSAYQPTKVNMAELTSQRQEPSRFAPAVSQSSKPDVVRGAYQPIGKVDIAAIRREAQDKGQTSDDRPTVVKGAYEPVGKVDIAAIRAKAQAAPPSSSSISPAPTGTSVTDAGGSAETAEPKSLADRSAAFSGNGGRLSSMPKPKPAGKFGGASAFGGTRAPVPGGFDSQPAAPASAQVGAASRTFADQGGKTPAQLWAEKKGTTGGAPAPVPSAPLTGQASGSASGGWQSGYTGKKWGDVQTKHAAGVPVNATGDDIDQPREQEAPTSSAPGGIGSIRDQFKGAQPIGVASERAAPAPPPMDLGSKPNTGINRAVPVPGMSRPAEETASIPPPPAQPPRTPTPEQEEEGEEERAYSPVRIAQPVARTEEKPLEKPEEPQAALPIRSLDKQVPSERELEAEPQVEEHDPARAAAEAVAEQSSAKAGGQSAIVQYDYAKDEPNEIDLVEGQTVSNIEQVDADWWYGQNAAGEMGLFPSNYVELIESKGAPSAAPSAAKAAPVPPAAPAAAQGKTATAEYDYEADEPNELSFPEGAKITNVEFPDDDWWLGEYGGKQGLFPANYVKLD